MWGGHGEYQGDNRQRRIEGKITGKKQGGKKKEHKGCEGREDKVYRVSKSLELLGNIDLNRQQRSEIDSKIFIADKPGRMKAKFSIF